MLFAMRGSYLNSKTSLNNSIYNQACLNYIEPLIIGFLKNFLVFKINLAGECLMDIDCKECKSSFEFEGKINQQFMDCPVCENQIDLYYLQVEVQCKSCSSVFDFEGQRTQHSLNCPVCHEDIVILKSIFTPKTKSEPAKLFRTAWLDFNFEKGFSYFASLIINSNHIFIIPQEFFEHTILGNLPRFIRNDKEAAFAQHYLREKIGKVFDIIFLSDLDERYQSIKYFKNLPNISPVIVIRKDQVKEFSKCLMSCRIKFGNKKFLTLNHDTDLILDALKTFNYNVGECKTDFI